MISLAAFLGNCGREYEGNRHNAAWLFCSSLPYGNLLSWQKKFKGQYASFDALRLAEETRRLYAQSKGSDIPCVPGGGAGDDKLYFLKPETFMNLSGQSIGELTRFYRIAPEQILVIHDEIELPAGTVSLKWSGGLGGHNGLRSAKAVLGTADFWRLRIGIGRPDHGDIADYVLSDFSADEKIILSQIFPPLARLLTAVLLNGPEPYLKGWTKKNLMAD